MMKGSSTLTKVRDEAINWEYFGIKRKVIFPSNISERSEETFLITVEREREREREPINMNLLALNEK